MIRIEHLTKVYGSKTAVQDLSLEVQAGEVFAFLGPNGAGKTTTIKVLAGLLRPTEGTASICGYDVWQQPLEAKACLSYVPDQPYLYEKLTGREFMRLVADLYGIRPEVSRKRMESLIERFDIGAYLDEMTENYSHGMKQRVVLAASLMHDPRVLVVDEPMVGLDPRSARTVKETFRERAEASGTLFISTHTLSLAEQVASRIGIVNHGRLVACGTLAELRSKVERDTDLEELFLSLTSAAAD